MAISNTQERQTLNRTQDLKGKLVVAKLLHAAFLASILVYARILVRLPSLDIALLAGNPLLNTAVWVLALLAAYNLWFWYYWPRLLLKARIRNPEKSLKAREPLFFHVVRTSLLEAIAIYGLVLGVLGGVIRFTLPFCATAFVMLAATFPTKGKWDKMCTAFGQSHQT